MWFDRIRPSILQISSFYSEKEAVFLHLCYKTPMRHKSPPRQVRASQCHTCSCPETFGCYLSTNITVHTSSNIDYFFFPRTSLVCLSRPSDGYLKLCWHRVNLSDLIWTMSFVSLLFLSSKQKHYPCFFLSLPAITSSKIIRYKDNAPSIKVQLPIKWRMNKEKVNKYNWAK